MDQITIEAARRGDRGSQAALLRHLQDTWYRMSLSLLANPDDARDAVQETALRFLRDLPRFRGQSSISTWSIGIVINVTREMRRKSRPIDEETFTARQRLPESLENEAQKKESNELLRATMHQLPERQREALMLRYFEELSIEETAVAMDCATGTVKATVHQALRALKTKLKALT